MILAWLCRFNVPNYCSIIIVNITFVDFNMSMQLISSGSMSFHLQELIKIKKWYVFYRLSHIIYIFLNIYIIYDPIIYLINTLIPILCD